MKANRNGGAIRLRISAVQPLKNLKVRAALIASSKLVGTKMNAATAVGNSNERYVWFGSERHKQFQ